MTAPEDGSMALTVELRYCPTASLDGPVWHFVQSVSRTPLYKYTKGSVFYGYP